MDTQKINVHENMLLFRTNVPMPRADLNGRDEVILVVEVSESRILGLPTPKTGPDGTLEYLLPTWIESDLLTTQYFCTDYTPAQEYPHAA